MLRCNKIWRRYTGLRKRAASPYITSLYGYIITSSRVVQQHVLRDRLPKVLILSVLFSFRIPSPSAPADPTAICSTLARLHRHGNRETVGARAAARVVRTANHLGICAALLQSSSGQLITVQLSSKFLTNQNTHTHTWAVGRQTYREKMVSKTCVIICVYLLYFRKSKIFRVTIYKLFTVCRLFLRGFRPVTAEIFSTLLI